jgi:hypothetical protein
MYVFCSPAYASLALFMSEALNVCTGHCHAARITVVAHLDALPWWHASSVVGNDAAFAVPALKHHTP